MPLTEISFSIRNNYSDVDVNAQHRMPESHNFRRKEIDNSISPTVSGEFLPVPQARGGKVKSKKIPPQSKSGHSILNSSKKISVIYSKTRNTSWGRGSARKINDQKNDSGRESMMSSRSDVFGILKNSAVEIQRKDKKNTAGIQPVPVPVHGQHELEKVNDKSIVAEEKQAPTQNYQLSYPVERVIPFTTPKSALSRIIAARLRGLC